MKKLNGFTIIELMVTVAITAILLTVAIPSFLDTMRINRLTTQSSNIITALNTARSEAIKRGASVEVCSSLFDSDPPTCDGTNDWGGTGWLVMQQVGDPDPIRVWDSLSSGSFLIGDVAKSDDATKITYSARGLASGTICLKLTSTGASVNEQRTISVSPMGRTKTTVGVLPVGHECN